MINKNITLITSGKNWMEQAGIDQLCGVSKLSGVVKTVGLPDLHPGKSPVGIAVLSEGKFYPHLIGNDIGCGMSLLSTSVKVKRFKQDKWVTRLNAIRTLSDLPAPELFEEECPISDLGTIGAGNHFAEFQCVDKIYMEGVCEELGISKDKVMLLIHSGSRHYGQEILSRYFRPEGILENSKEADLYLAEQEQALLWAGRNRIVVAKKMLSYLGVCDDTVILLENCHNYLEQTEKGWLHRKGSVSTRQKAVIIPGSRGSLTYLCIPREHTEHSLDSVSHGAGRKWARSICRSRIHNKYNRDSIRSTELKSRIVCHDTNLLYAEAPEAYKNIEQIIQTLIDFELIDVAAVFRPLITYKG